MTKPEAKKLRRRPYKPGVGIEFKLYPLGMDISLQISKLQVDYQDPGAASEYTVVVSPVPQIKAPGTGNLHHV